MAKYIDLPNLKENLTNFLNKKINPIYAKKTEIPSNVSELNNDKSYQTAEEVGQAVTDGVARIVAGAPEDFDTLKEMSDWISSHETSAAAMNSAISDNSVAIANHTSNSDIHVTKEEKTKWNKLDSDLKDGTIIVAEATKATQDAQGNTIDTTYAKKTEVPQGTVIDDALSSTSANPVQNKIVKAEFDQVNSNLDDYGLLNKFDGSVTYNYWYNKENGEYQSSGTSATLTNKTNCSVGNIVRVMCPSATNVSIVFYNSSNEFISGTDKDGTDVQFIAPTNASYCRINFYKNGGFGGNIGKIGVYINNAIDEIKNDLSNIKDGTTPAAKAVADEDGNNIKSTYTKKTELDAKANITDPVFTGSFSQNRAPGSPIGTNSHAEGEFPVASGNNSHAEGTGTEASGEGSHAEGQFTIASGNGSHAEGTGAIASGEGSHAEGHNAEASGESSHAEGNGTTSSGNGSHAEGVFTKASGNNSHAEGTSTEASNYSSHSAGKYNASMITGGAANNTTGTAFVIGNGTSAKALSNAFSVQYDGTVKAKSTITASTTADYAEFFEWLDENPNNEDRVGYFVTLDGNRIKIASDNDDYILGIVSGEPFVLGNGDCDTWNGMYLHDEFRRTIYEPAPKVEEVEIKEEREETYIDEETGEEKIRTVEVIVGHEFKEVEGEFDGTRPKLNPDYDNTQLYISRFDRKEWSPVGMLGVLAVRHDGTAKVNGYVTVNKDGIATACDRNTENSYRVIKANTDSVVEIIFK